MQVSSEIRWFWHGSLPPRLEEWFRGAENHGFTAGGGEHRTDLYLRDDKQPELGIKQRGGKEGTEIKGLVAVHREGISIGPFVGPIEIWAKWSSDAVQIPENAMIKVGKRRWLRKFATDTGQPHEIELDEREAPLDAQPLPTNGCNVELTLIHVGPEQLWWSLGFEAFGSLSRVQASLEAAATALVQRRPPSLEAGVLASYPVWLSSLLDAKRPARV